MKHEGLSGLSAIERRACKKKKGMVEQMDILQVIQKELNVKLSQVEAAVQLIDEGNTIPFIARYRKEVTGSLNDEQLRQLDERLTYLRNLEEKKAQVLATIEEQGKLTDELRKEIEEAMTQVAVEDLYRPYRPKRRTRATIAKEKGLEPLANIILLQMADKELSEYAAEYISEEKGVADAKEALAGAMDIIAESISDEADYRTYIRKLTMDEGVLISEAKDEKTESVYEMYYQFSEPVKKLAGHRILAINRGENECACGSTGGTHSAVPEKADYCTRKSIYYKDIRGNCGRQL